MNEIDVTVADTVWTRLRGLIGRASLLPGESLLLRPARSVHTCFMRFPVDVVFLDSEDRVLGVHHGLRPWRMRAQRGARAVLELAAGEAKRLGIERGRLAPCSPGAFESVENRATGFVADGR